MDPRKKKAEMRGPTEAFFHWSSAGHSPPFGMRYVPLDRNRKDKTMKRIKNNDLTHWFIRDHSELPESYLKHCREFFESLGIKTKANELQADKLQATSSKRQADAETNKK